MFDLPANYFGCILADPPWAFRSYTRQDALAQRGPQYHYQTMLLPDLLALPVADIAAKDCALFMWILDPMADRALRLAEAWGFKFKTIAFVWAKGEVGKIPPIGMGYWTRKQTEQCWLFTRGSPPRLSKGVAQLIQAPRREHSRKPEEQYERIEALVGGPYLELFARSAHPGWTAWGDQTGKFLSAEAEAMLA